MRSKRDLKVGGWQGKRAEALILLRRKGVIKWVVGVDSATLANPKIDDVILADDLHSYCAVSSHHYHTRDRHGHNRVEIINKLPKWAQTKLRQFGLLYENNIPTRQFVFAKAMSLDYNIEELESAHTTALVSLEMHHSHVNIVWVGAGVTSRTFKFPTSQITKAIECAKQLRELSQNLIDTHASVTALANEYGRKCTPLRKFKTHKRMDEFPLI